MAAIAVEHGTVSETNLYVRSVTLDGMPLDRPEITHAQLTAASTLHFEMGSMP